MLKAIYQARKIIAKQVKNGSYDLIGSKFSMYQKAFYQTNENMAYYLNIFNINGKESALTVAGSGDHIFNLVEKNIKNIDSFDINKLTEYFALGLKRAMICKYNYYEYVTYINLLPSADLEFITEFIHDLLPFMDLKYRIFWSEIASFNYQIQIRYNTDLNLFQMLYVNVFPSTTFLQYNNYLQDEFAYENFRSKLNAANITFKGIDALDIPSSFKDKKYDVILLSNILDYANTRWGDNWDYKELKKYILNLKGICKEDAIIFLKYIIAYKTRNGTKVDIFRDSSISECELEDDLYVIPTIISPERKDGIILKRIKIDK